MKTKTTKTSNAFDKLIAFIKKHPGKTGVELKKLGFTERHYGSLRAAEKAGVIAWSGNGGWFVPSDELN